MKLEIVRRSFALIDNTLIERDEFLRREMPLSDVRMVSGFCVFVPGANRDELRKRITKARLDFVHAADPAGTWIVGGFWDLERAFDEIAAT